MVTFPIAKLVPLTAKLFPRSTVHHGWSSAFVMLFEFGYGIAPHGFMQFGPQKELGGGQYTYSLQYVNGNGDGDPIPQLFDDPSTASAAGQAAHEISGPDLDTGVVKSELCRATLFSARLVSAGIAKLHVGPLQPA